MESAFGIDHGEISKIGMPKIPKPFSGGGSRVATPKAPTHKASAPAPAGPKHKAPGTPVTPKVQVQSALKPITAAGQTGLARAGSWMKQNKKPIGIAGGGSAVGGGVAYGANRKK